MPSIKTVWPSDPAYLKAAFSKLGLSEIAGPKHEKQVLAMYVACGHPEIIEDEVPWCAAFVGWSLVKGNLPNTGSLLAISYAQYGTALNKRSTIPRGAIGVTKRVGGNHVFFVLSDDGTTITRLGGNQENGRGGGVTISTCRKSDVIAFRMPIASEAADPVGLVSDGADTPPPPPAPTATTTVVTARTAAGTGAAVLAGGQVVATAIGGAGDVAEKTTDLIDKSGQIISATKQVVTIPKPGFWGGVLHFVTSPEFVVIAVLFIAAMWGLVWFIQRNHKPAEG